MAVQGGGVDGEMMVEGCYWVCRTILFSTLNRFTVTGGRRHFCPWYVELHDFEAIAVCDRGDHCTGDVFVRVECFEVWDGELTKAGNAPKARG